MEKSRGFTLAEMVIALSVFVVVFGFISVIFASIIRQQRELAVRQEISNQQSYVMEYMSRALKYAKKDTSGKCLGDAMAGYYYKLGYPDPTSGFYYGVKFIDEDDICREFFLDENGSLKEARDGQAAQNLLSEKLNVEFIRFVVNGDKDLEGASQYDLVQPRLTVSLGIRLDSKSQKEQIMQTTISQSRLNEK